MVIADLKFLDFVSVFTDASSEFLHGAIVHSLAAVYVIFILIQLRLSTVNSNAAVDSSPSFKLYKRKILSNLSGRTLAAFVSIFKAFPFMVSHAVSSSNDVPTPDELMDLVHSFSDTPFPNHKKIVKPNIGNWGAYLNGELTSTLGIILSCPASNGGRQKFNLKSDVVSQIDKPSQILSLLGIDQEFLDKFGIVETDDDSTVFKLIQSTLNQTEGGLPAEVGEINDPFEMKSLLEDKYLNIVRKAYPGDAPSAASTSDFSSKILPLLSKQDLGAYKAAKALGNKSLISNLEAIFAKKHGRSVSS